MGFKIKRIIAWFLSLLHISDLKIKHEKKKYNSQYIRIINYHDTQGDEIRKHIKWLKKHYSNVNYDTFKDFMNGVALSGDKPGVMLTFDDGLAGNYATAMNTLKEEGMTGYYMISSDLIGKENYMTQKQIIEMLQAGHVIGCHTATHHRMNQSDTAEILDYEIRSSKDKLEGLFNIPVEIFCWCGGEEHTYTKNAEKVIESSGYKYGFMTNSFPLLMNDDKFHIQRINVEDTWSISLLKFQICGLMDNRLKSKRERVNELTRIGD